jgi:tetratricopeptide (TPR) repeat protein
MRFLCLIVSILILNGVGCKSKTETETDNETNNDLSDIANKLYFENRYLEAVSAFDKAIEMDSLNGELYFRRAYSLCQVNMHERSIPDYLKSASLGFNEFDSYYSIGILYMTILHDDSIAEHYFNKCLQIDPNSEQVKEMLKIIKGGDKNNFL